MSNPEMAPTASSEAPHQLCGSSSCDSQYFTTVFHIEFHKTAVKNVTDAESVKNSEYMFTWVNNLSCMEKCRNVKWQINASTKLKWYAVKLWTSEFVWIPGRTVRKDHPQCSPPYCTLHLQRQAWLFRFQQTTWKHVWDCLNVKQGASLRTQHALQKLEATLFKFVLL